MKIFSSFVGLGMIFEYIYSMLRNRSKAFTVIEIITVIAVLAVIGVIAYPALEQYYSGIKVSQTLRTLADDIEYARNYAHTRYDLVHVILDPVTESYEIQAGEDAGSLALIEHPWLGGNFSVTLDNGVDMNSTSFTANTIIFDKSGRPEEGGVITLNGSRTVTVLAGTGFTELQ